jgi:hypothetical protein
MAIIVIKLHLYKTRTKFFWKTEVIGEKAFGKLFNTSLANTRRNRGSKIS